MTLPLISSKFCVIHARSNDNFISELSENISSDLATVIETKENAV